MERENPLRGHDSLWLLAGDVQSIHGELNSFTNSQLQFSIHLQKNVQLLFGRSEVQQQNWDKNYLCLYKISVCMRVHSSCLDCYCHFFHSFIHSFHPSFLPSFLLSLFMANCNHYIIFPSIIFFSICLRAMLILRPIFVVFFVLFSVFFFPFSETLFTVNGKTKKYFLINNAFFYRNRIASIFRLFRAIQCHGPDTFTRCRDEENSCGCSLFHCYLCSPNKMGTKEGVLIKHFEKKHWSQRVSHNGRVFRKKLFNY